MPGIFLIVDLDMDFRKIKKFPEKNSLFFPTAISGTFYPTPPHPQRVSPVGCDRSTRSNKAKKVRGGGNKNLGFSRKKLVLQTVSVVVVGADVRVSCSQTSSIGDI